jgi:hypothetical protein
VRRCRTTNGPVHAPPLIVTKLQAPPTRKTDSLYEDIDLPQESPDKIIEKLEVEIAKRESRRGDRVERMGKKLTSLVRQKDNLLKFYYAEAIQGEEYREERERIAREAETLAQELEQENASLTRRER